MSVCRVHTFLEQLCSVPHYIFFPHNKTKSDKQKPTQNPNKQNLNKQKTPQKTRREKLWHTNCPLLYVMLRGALVKQCNIKISLLRLLHTTGVSWSFRSFRTRKEERGNGCIALHSGCDRILALTPDLCGGGRGGICMFMGEKKKEWLHQMIWGHPVQLFELVLCRFGSSRACATASPLLNTVPPLLQSNTCKTLWNHRPKNHKKLRNCGEILGMSSRLGFCTGSPKHT